MRTTTYSLFTLLLAFLCVSCIADDENVLYVSNIENEFKAFNVDNNDQFIGNEANLVIDAGNYSDIQVTLTDSTNTTVTITKIDDLNYTISSTVAEEQLVKITAIDSNGNELIGYRRMFFHEHGTTDYIIVEGVEIDYDSYRKLTALHGEPDAKEIRESTTQTIVNEVDGTTELVYTPGIEIWYYFSKGFYAIIDSRTEIVSSMTIYGIAETRVIDDINYDVVPYAYEIDGLSKFNTIEGLLMDEVYEKYGEPTDKVEGTTSQLYAYGNYAFVFSSDNVDDYTGKKVSSIIML